MHNDYAMWYSTMYMREQRIQKPETSIGFPHPELGVLPLLERAQQHAFGDHREPLNDIII